MQAIHAETEKSDEREDARPIVGRILDHVRELELSIRDIVGNGKAYELMNELPGLDLNIEDAAFLNNCENVVEGTALEKIFAEFPVSNFSVFVDVVYIVVKIVIKYIKCHWWRCKWLC